MSTNKGERTLGELANYVAQDLPEDWEVVVTIENGAAVVTLYDPLGEDALEFSPDDSLEEQVLEAVTYAINHDSEF